MSTSRADSPLRKVSPLRRKIGGGFRIEGTVARNATELGKIFRRFFLLVSS